MVGTLQADRYPALGSLESVKMPAIYCPPNYASNPVRTNCLASLCLLLLIILLFQLTAPFSPLLNLHGPCGYPMSLVPAILSGSGDMRHYFQDPWPHPPWGLDPPLGLI